MDPHDPPAAAAADRTKNSSSRSSSSSTSSDSLSSSDEDDYFQIDTGELEKPILHPGGTVSDGFEFQQRSPPVQVMPDPNRIPSSVFARNKSTAPAEWSVASNESLFSIHMGNSSFSRDHILLSMDSSLSPLPPLPLSPKAKTMTLLPPTLSRPPTSPKQDHLESAGPSTNSGTGRDQAMTSKAEEVEEEKLDSTNKAGSDLMNNNSSASISRKSDGSTTSFRSFAFPILSGERRSGSIKVEPEPQQQPQSDDQLEQQQSTKKETPKTETTTPAAETKGWLSCFSCCSFCC